ncbi:hypothetical protein FACS1894188_05240 [Clostridia bacterium]|nr:hypothetical protein FACS1894188_05240 [Clostridia bacterium]
MPFEFISILLLSAIVIALTIFFFVKCAFNKQKNISQSDEISEIVRYATDIQTDISRNEVVISDIESLILKDNNGAELALTRTDTQQLSEKNIVK